MTLSRFTNEETIKQGKLMVGNSLNNNPVVEITKEFGYPKERLEGIMQIINESENDILIKKESLADKLKTQADYEQKLAVAKEEVEIIAQLARITLKGDKAARQKMGLIRTKKIKIADWQSYTKQLLTLPLSDPELMSKLGKCGINEEKILKAKALVDSAIAAYSLKEQKKGESQMATDKQGKSITALKKILIAYRDTCKVVLKKTPQLMETIGILQRSEGTRRKKSIKKPLEEAVNKQEKEEITAEKKSTVKEENRRDTQAPMEEKEEQIKTKKAAIVVEKAEETEQKKTPAAQQTEKNIEDHEKSA